MDKAERYTDLPDELAFDPLEVREKYGRALPGYMRRFGELYSAIYERFGDDGLELIRDVSREYGARIARNVQKNRELKGVAEVGKYILKVFDMVSDDWTVTEFSEDRLVISVSRCPYPLEQEAVCKAHTCMESALVSTLDSGLNSFSTVFTVCHSSAPRVLCELGTS